MNNSILKAVEKIYSIIGIDNVDVLSDIKNGYLTENKARNGETVVWYYDGVNECCLYVDTLEELTAEEIENELQ